MLLLIVSVLIFVTCISWATWGPGVPLPGKRLPRWTDMANTISIVGGGISGMGILGGIALIAMGLR